MTFQVHRAVWELRRQGFHDIACEAEARWARGEILSPDSLRRLSSWLTHLVTKCHRDSYALAASNRASDLF